MQLSYLETSEYKLIWYFIKHWNLHLTFKKRWCDINEHSRETRDQCHYPQHILWSQFTCSIQTSATIIMLPSFLKMEDHNKVTKLMSCGIRLKVKTETYWLWTASTDCHLNSSTITMMNVCHTTQECSIVRLFLYTQKFTILTYQYTIMKVTRDLRGSRDNDYKIIIPQSTMLCRLVVNYSLFKNF
jgi:hypothetical protein